jgi:hypothetical protein
MEEMTSNEVDIYPVPTYDMIYINVANALNINIYNVSGQLVYSAENKNEDVLTVDVSDWKKSVYFVEIIDEYLNQKTAKFVVK